jgi:hypothetical protein
MDHRSGQRRGLRLTTVNAIKPVVSLLRNRHPDGLPRQTSPVRHPAQLPARGIASGTRQQLGEHLADHRPPLDAVRGDQLSATQRHYRVALAPSHPG